MRRRSCEACLLVMLGCAVGCGDASPSSEPVTAGDSTALGKGSDPAGDTGGDADDEGLDDVDDADPGEPPADPGASAASPTFPAYVVYLEPTSGSTLAKDASAFIASHDPGGVNRAASFPPHVTVTGFFRPTPPLSNAAMIANFGKAITAAGGTPFGQPTIENVVCNRGRRLIYLQVKTPAQPKVGKVSRFYRFSTEVVKLLDAPPGARKRLAKYHLTLFNGPKSFSTSRFDDFCGDAIRKFVDRSYSTNPWEEALYYSPTEPTPANPLTYVWIQTSRRVTP